MAVREVSPGKFVATIYHPDARGGTKHVGTFTTRAEAESAAEDAKRQRDSQKTAPPETCESFARRWPRDYTRRRGVSTLEHNRERVSAFIRDFGDRPLCG